MLQKLQIQNYAIIQQISIHFADHLNVITGETGAGKSILTGALGLVLGQRADSSALMDKSSKCIVEAHFISKPSEPLKNFFLANDLDPGDEIILRREIAPTGKSRSFINDTPVNLSQLKEISLLLIDLHQQFDTLELTNTQFHRQVIDAMADHADLLNRLKVTYEKYTQLKLTLQKLKEEQANAEKELSYNQFLYDELEKAAFKDNELEALDAEMKVLSNAENIKQQLNQISFELKHSDLPLAHTLKQMQQKLHSLTEYGAHIQHLHDRMNSMVIELLDIADELENANEAIHYDAERIQIVNDRIEQGYTLLKKHNVQNTAALLQIQEELARKLENLQSMNLQTGAMDIELQKLYDECMALSKIITQNREAQIKPFVQKVNKLLTQVGMPNAAIKAEINEIPLSVQGNSEVIFLFDANKSGRFEPLQKVASGGELSRVMLSIKYLVAKKLQLPTLIFDEIDSGISGEAARQVGIIMKELAIAHQLISITHQPQIAAKANNHYYVFKDIINNKVATSVRLLNQDERITAIAQMLSGEKPTAAALQNAREMVSN